MSLSWGAPEAAIAGKGNNLQIIQAHEIFAAAQAAGITVFASAGDSGASNLFPFSNASYPASDPLVTSVGGTDLFISDFGDYENETVWNDSSSCPFSCTNGIVGATGGSPSQLFPAPYFQELASGNSRRSTVDVSYNAGGYTAILVYIGFFSGPSNGFYFFGGTSQGPPQWAAIMALVDQAAGHAIGFVSPALYAISSGGEYGDGFNDITAGDNRFFGPGFTAGIGYDYPTGLGTPKVVNLIQSLVGN